MKGSFTRGFTQENKTDNIGTVDAGVVQLVSAWPSELEVPGSILGDSNVCFNLLLVRVILASITRKTDRGRGVKCAPRATKNELLSSVLSLLKKVVLPFLLFMKMNPSQFSAGEL